MSFITYDCEITSARLLPFVNATSKLMRKLSHDQKSIAYWQSKINKLNSVLVYQNRRVDYDDKDQA